MSDLVKSCPECLENGETFAMRLEKRARPDGGAMFVGEDQWVCPECGHSEDVEPPAA
jgi:rubredoxin